MKTYQLHIEDGDDFIKNLKVESAKAEKTMKEYIIEAVKEKMEREKNNLRKKGDE